MPLVSTVWLSRHRTTEVFVHNTTHLWRKHSNCIWGDNLDIFKCLACWWEILSLDWSRYIDSLWIFEAVGFLQRKVQQWSPSITTKLELIWGQFSHNLILNACCRRLFILHSSNHASISSSRGPIFGYDQQLVIKLTRIQITIVIFKGLVLNTTQVTASIVNDISNFISR